MIWVWQVVCGICHGFAQCIYRLLCVVESDCESSVCVFGERFYNPKETSYSKEIKMLKIISDRENRLVTVALVSG